MIKQILVIRKDLKMRRGKECSQAAHASMKVFFDRMRKNNREILTGDGGVSRNGEPHTKSVFVYDWNIDMTPEMEAWKEGIFTKICVGVDSEAGLLEIHNKALEAGIVTALIQDCGKTEFNGVPTYTCVAVGPDTDEKIDPITRHLRLL